MPTRLDTAEIAHEHIDWARSAGLSPRETAAAIGWTVPHDVAWGMVAALFAGEAAKVLDSAAKRHKPETAKAGGWNLRLAARGGVPRVSYAGEAAKDLTHERVKSCAGIPISQPVDSTGQGFIGLNAGRGLTRSIWRSAN
jgi:hypothetical protein